ncbi:MAG TPA: hypothetical protein VGQ00_00230 [Candidatus Norongarragalinales archaeon]|jgi:hypothetical protein|nr:hypothetical protein [Candidatus Norongarragalinales archaeon]
MVVTISLVLILSFLSFSVAAWLMPLASRNFASTLRLNTIPLGHLFYDAAAGLPLLFLVVGAAMAGDGLLAQRIAFAGAAVALLLPAAIAALVSKAPPGEVDEVSLRVALSAFLAFVLIAIQFNFFATGVLLIYAFAAQAYYMLKMRVDVPEQREKSELGQVFSVAIFVLAVIALAISSGPLAHELSITSEIFPIGVATFVLALMGVGLPGLTEGTSEKWLKSWNSRSGGAAVMLLTLGLGIAFLTSPVIDIGSAVLAALVLAASIAFWIVPRSRNKKLVGAALLAILLAYFVLSLVFS